MAVDHCPSGRPPLGDYDIAQKALRQRIVGPGTKAIDEGVQARGAGHRPGYVRSGAGVSDDRNPSASGGLEATNGIGQILVVGESHRPRPRTEGGIDGRRQISRHI